MELEPGTVTNFFFVLVRISGCDLLQWREACHDDRHWNDPALFPCLGGHFPIRSPSVVTPVRGIPPAGNVTRRCSPCYSPQGLGHGSLCRLDWVRVRSGLDHHLLDTDRDLPLYMGLNSSSKYSISRFLDEKVQFQNQISMINQSILGFNQILK